MMIDGVKINVPLIIESMHKKGWTVTETCANCGVTSKTLRSVLNGVKPRRLDALFRILDGLEISAEEALKNGGTPEKARLYVLSDRRGGPSVA